MVLATKLEIACFNLNSALIAQQNGADRVELCDGFDVGGTTPSVAMTRKARASLTIDLFVMIRPRGGNFVYSKEEFEQMKTSINELKKEKVDGFVFGILKEDNTINKEQNSELIALAKPFPCTFHRAFDEVSEAFQSLEDTIKCGFQTILTSGQMPYVETGVDSLAALVKMANNRIVIMPGGGLRSSNCKSIQQKTKANYFHSSAITDGNQMANPIEIIALLSNLKRY
jgi:copper homeostasis protein